MASGPLPNDHPIYATILQDFNKLREIEDRPQVTALPEDIALLSHERLLTLSFRLKKEIQWHINSKRVNKTLTLEYKNQIFLNETEYQTWLYNRRQDKLNQPPINYIPASFIADSDKDYYLSQTTAPDALLFVTDSPAQLVYTPTYVDALKTYRATHSLDGAFKSSPPLSASSITDSRFDFPLPSSSPLNSSTEVDKIPIEGLKLEGDTSRQKIASVSSESINSDDSKMTDPNEDPRKDIKMEEALMKIQKLEQENEQLHRRFNNLTMHPRAAQTERQQLGDMQSQINDIVQMIKLISVQNPLDITTDSERQIAGKITEAKVRPPMAQLFVSLERPTNIISISTPRDPPTLQCLKPTTIINTIGVYDPDNQPEADFRCIWDRILDHTRNNLLYEHEYITCLRIILKGSAGMSLDKLNKEYGGNLDSILDALQDLFIPQHTIFDEFVELNQFKRKPNEHMRTMVRRASLLVFKLKDTVSPAAWEDRRYTLLSQIIKQVIDRKTFVHLRAEEIKCAQMGQCLTIDAMTNIIEFFESANDLIPKNEIKLTYDVQTMRLNNQPDMHKSDMKELKDELASLKASIKVLAPKRPRLNDSIPLASKNKLGTRKPIIPKRRLDTRMDTSQSDMSQNKGIKRPIEQNNTPIQNPYRTAQYQKPPPRQSQFTPAPATSAYKPTNNYQYRGQNKYDPQLYSRYNKTKLDQYDRTHYKKRYNNNTSYNKNKYPKKSYSFKGKKHNVELKFYKCGICPDAHEQGTSCSTIRAVHVSPNMY